jgi:hypothetical protein
MPTGRQSAHHDEDDMLEAVFIYQTIGSPMNETPHPWGWTPERRARQAEAIHRWQPWASATGPITSVGKAISSRNADRPNSVMRQLNEIVGELKHVKRLVRNVAARRER